MTYFDPNAVGKKGSIFGYPYNSEEADLVLIPVSWDATASYGGGTSFAPELILDESTLIDFSIPFVKRPYKYPVFMEPLENSMKLDSSTLRSKAEKLISKLEEVGQLTNSEKVIQSEVNRGCEEMVKQVKRQAAQLLSEGKVVGTVGGDHSTSLGLIQALGEVHEEFGILQIDAHMDLRDAFGGFTHSHASVMKNALGISSLSKIIQVGIRDYCEEEESLLRAIVGRVEVYFDEVMQRKKWEKSSWPNQVKRIISKLPDKVYLSFDMDGLQQSLCPNTGTPVPGGLNFYEAVYLLEEIARSGREIIGFDISETGNSIWDANVAARILFRLCTYTDISRNKLLFI